MFRLLQDCLACVVGDMHWKGLPSMIRRRDHLGIVCHPFPKQLGRLTQYVAETLFLSTLTWPCCITKQPLPYVLGVCQLDMADKWAGITWCAASCIYRLTGLIVDLWSCYAGLLMDPGLSDFITGHGFKSSVVGSLYT